MRLGFDHIMHEHFILRAERHRLGHAFASDISLAFQSRDEPDRGGSRRARR
jgi:hypothetical protein